MKNIPLIPVFVLLIVGISTSQIDFVYAETIPEFSSAVVVTTSSTTLTKAMEFMDNVLLELSSGSRTAKNLGSELSQAAQLHKLFAHEDKEIKKEFQAKFHEFRKALKEILGIGQSAEEKSLLNQIEKADLKIKMQVEKNNRDYKNKNKIQTAIDLHDTKIKLQKIKNQIGIEKSKFIVDNKELELLKQTELDLLKQSLIFEAKSNNEKITPEKLKSIEKKVTEVKESHNKKSDKGNSDNGNGKDSGKGNDKKSEKSKGNNGKSKGKKK